MYLTAHLMKHCKDQVLCDIIQSIAHASVTIHTSITLTDTHKSGADNATGDAQSPLDLTSDQILHDHVTDTGHIRWIASEERESVIDTEEGSYFIAYDPYDGGSVGDANITFGSIIGIWSSNPLGGPVGTNLEAGCLALYGPRTTLIIGFKGQNPACFEYDESEKEFTLIKDQITIAPKAQHFAPGNLTASNTNPRYKSCIDHWVTSGLKLRYSGALVTDINHILMKGDGIFTYPSDERYPTGRLRLLYEAGPIGLLLEGAHGVALTENGARLLDQTISNPHERISFFMGSSQTIKDAIHTMNDL